MKKIIILLFIGAVFVLAGCSNPITDWQLSKDQEKIVNAFKNVAEAEKMDFNFGIDVDSIYENEKDNFQLDYSGHIDVSDIENQKSDLTMKYVESGDNIEFMGLDLNMIAQGNNGIYIKPKIAVAEDQYVDIFEGGKYFALSQSFINQLSLMYGVEISDEQENLQELPKEIKEKLAETIKSLSQDLKVVNKSSNTYTVEIPKEKLIIHLKSLSESLFAIYNDNLSVDSTKENQEDNFSAAYDFGLKKEDINEMIDDINNSLQNDPVKMVIKLSNNGQEIENAKINLQINPEDNFSYDADIEFSFTKFNIDKEIEIPSASNTIAFDSLLLIAGNEGLASVLDPKFIELTELTTEEINQMATLFGGILSYEKNIDNVEYYDDYYFEEPSPELFDEDIIDKENIEIFKGEEKEEPITELRKIKEKNKIEK